MLERVAASFDDLPGPVAAGFVAATYVALAQYVIWLNDPVNAGAGYWPAAGVTVGVMALLPARRWAWVVGAVFAAELVSSTVHGYPVVAVLWWSAGNSVEPLVAVLVLRVLGSRGRLSPVPELVRFLVAAVVVGPLVGAAVGSIGTALEFDRGWAEVALRWWIGDGLGVLVVAPLLLCLREPGGPRRSSAEAVALAVVVVIVPVVAFPSWRSEWDVVLPYLVFPLMMWASVRFGIRGAAFTGFGVAQVANLATALGYGPFHTASSSDDHRVAVLQVFLGAALTAGLAIATVVSDSLARARLFERQRAAAETLQDAVLPERMPIAPGLDLAARYVPATQEATLHVGGDWYDAFELGSGAIALVVGDVAGHDLSAAVVMAQLRHGLRSLLLDAEDPCAVLAALDRQLALGDGPVATAICARYRAGRLEWANAGHPPLLLVRAGGQVRYLDDDPSPLLGLGASRYDLHGVDLLPGDVVVGFTDGLIEHRSWSLVDALDHLARLVGSGPTGDLDALCDRLLAEGLGGRRREDDACLLVLRVS